MKKLLYLLMILALPLSFAACGDDDEEEEAWGTDINPIEGTWIHENGEYKFIYTADFIEKFYQWDDTLNDWHFTWENKYIINKNSFKYVIGGSLFYYKLENGFLYVGPDKEKWTKLRKE